MRCRLGEELEPTNYQDRKGRDKVVRYWLMEPEDDTDFVPNEEVDQLRWLAPAEAAELLSYPHDTRARRSPRPSASDEPRALPRPRRRHLDAARRPGRHADGRQRDRGDGGLDALRPLGQPGRRVRRRARHRRARRDRPRERGRAARRAARGDRLRLLDDRADDGVRRRRRPHAPAGRRDRLLAARPRCQRRPVGHPRRAQRRHGALRRARPGDARAARERGRGRPHRPHALGRGHPRLQRGRHDPGPARHRRRRPRRGRARVRRRGPRGAAPPDRRRARSAATRSRARPTSGSARTSASSGRGPSC